MTKNRVVITYRDKRTLKETELSYVEERDVVDTMAVESDARLLAAIFRPKYNKIVKISVSLETPVENFCFWGCKMCGNEWKSTNDEGFCSSCWTVWKS